MKKLLFATFAVCLTLALCLSAAAEPELEDPVSEAEALVLELLAEQAEQAKDPWEQALLAQQPQDFKWAEGQVSFALRAYDPRLKELGDYEEGKEDYLVRLYANATEASLACTLPVTESDGTLTAEASGQKALFQSIRKAASSAKSAFDDKRVRVALADYMLSARTMATAFGGTMDEARYQPLIGAQVKQSLDVSGGPGALVLKCTAADREKLLEQGYADALDKLSKAAYANQMSEEEIETAFLEALSAQAEALRKKSGEKYEFTFDFVELMENQDPGEQFSSYLSAYESEYNDKLAQLVERVGEMPDIPALDFPKSGRISGSSSGTLVNFKIPDDGMARYIQMRSVESDEVVVDAFIRPGGKASVRVPKGFYYILLGVGDTWYGTEHLFGDTGYYSRTQETEILSSRYYHTITLGGAKNGNMSSYGADPSDFQ